MRQKKKITNMRNLGLPQADLTDIGTLAADWLDYREAQICSYSVLTSDLFRQHTLKRTI